MKTEIEGMDPSKMDPNKKADVFLEGVTGLADALQMAPEDFILMLRWLLESAEATLLDYFESSGTIKH